MDRSLYPDGVVVRQTDLANTEESKAFHILRRHINSTSGGVVSGLLVTTNTTNTSTIDVSSGNGYSPNGEFVELKNIVTGISLADSTDGVLNYILLVYTETNDDARAHETDGTSKPTSANRSSRLEVLTESQYNQLQQTDNNLSNNSIDRSLIVAIVTSPGSGVAITDSDIELPTQFTGGVSAVNVTNNITGVDIIRISPLTDTGTGSLDFTVSSSELEWTAPNDISGTAVDVSAGGVFNLTSQPSGNRLRVIVQDTLLPTSDENDQISVTNIYTQNIPTHTPEDIQHRSFIGSGIPTTTNPHGLTPGDLGLGETQTEAHQDIMHANGISNDSASTVVEPTVDTGSIPHELDIVSMSPGDKIYIGGFIHTSIENTSYQFSDVSDDAHILFNCYLVNGGDTAIASLEKRERIRFNDIPPPSIAQVLQFREVSNTIDDGAAELRYSTGPDALEFKAPGDSFGDVVEIPTNQSIMRLFSSDTSKWIDVFVDDLANWGAVSAVTEDITISSLPTQNELSDRFLVASVPFSGSATGFLGFGFGVARSPNDVFDVRSRKFGFTSKDELHYDNIFKNFKVSIIDDRPAFTIESSSSFPIVSLADRGALHVDDSGDLWVWAGTQWRQVQYV